MLTVELETRFGVRALRCTAEWRGNVEGSVFYDVFLPITLLFLKAFSITVGANFSITATVSSLSSHLPSPVFPRVHL